MINQKLFLVACLFASLPSAFAGENMPASDFFDMKQTYEEAFSNKTTKSSKSCNLSGLTDKEIDSIFSRSLTQMKSVNNWGSFIKIPGQKFKLYSSNGNPVNRLALSGDFIEIKLPGDPTLRTYWVKIISMDLKKTASSSSFSLVVKPTHHPKSKRKEITDHFFTSEATNTFSLINDGLKLTSQVHGKNETANTTETINAASGVANMAIVHMGWGIEVPEYGRYGFQSLVWNKLNDELTNCNIE